MQWIGWIAARGRQRSNVSQQLERQIARSIEQLATEQQRWLEQQFEAGFSELSGSLVRQLDSGLEQLASSLITNNGQGAFSGVVNEDGRLSQSASNQISRVILSRLFPARTRTNTNESARSREAQNAYRLSRSQQQAELLRQMREGERNV